MRRSWLVGVFFVVLTGAWMGTHLQWQDPSGQVRSDRGSGTYSPFTHVSTDQADALEVSDCVCCHRSTSERHHQLRERAILPCMECHQIVFDEVSQIWKAQRNPDCTACHLSGGAGSDRHYLLNADLEKCRTCHEVLLDEAVKAYYIRIISQCDPAQPDSSVSHYSRHMQPTPIKCNSCHQCDLFDVHNTNCLLCHRSTDPVVKAAIQNNDVRCTTCHTESPHILVCSICHNNNRTYRPGDGPRVHMKHIKAVSCGTCHMIPQKTTLEPTGRHCAFCHETPRSYTMSQLPSLHRRHAAARGYFPFSCYMCHGNSFPLVPPTECFPCHDDKKYDLSMREQIHYTHNRIFDCSNCHPQPWLFDVSQSNDCERCHRLRTYSSQVAVHNRHSERQCWSCHSAREVSARAGTVCIHCHSSPRKTSFNNIHRCIRIKDCSALSATQKWSRFTRRPASRATPISKEP